MVSISPPSGTSGSSYRLYIGAFGATPKSTTTAVVKLMADGESNVKATITSTETP